MPSSFDLAIPPVLRHEGGYANNPNDPGGATNYGISLRWLHAQGHDVGDFDHDGEVDVNDIKAMSKEQAIELYRHYWWLQFGIDRIEFQPLATKLLDGGINMGMKQAVILMQRTVVNLGYMAFTVDGLLGPNTIKTVNDITSSNGIRAFDLMSQYAFIEQSFYNQLAKDHAPKFDQFLNGWLKRASEIYMPVP